MGALLLLTHAMQELGISRDLRRQSNLVDQTLQTFIEQFLRNRFDAGGIQTLYDLAFLRKLIDVRMGSDWTDVRQLLDQNAVHIREKVTAHLPIFLVTVAQSIHYRSPMDKRYRIKEISSALSLIILLGHKCYLAFF